MKGCKLVPAENQEKLPRTLKVALNQLLIFSINLIGIIGIMLILYSFISHYYNSQWSFIENLANPLSVICTIIATFITASSIYFPINDRKPEAFSLYISAPLVMIFCIAMLLFYYYNNLIFPEHLLNGIALLGLSGGLFRLISREVII